MWTGRVLWDPNYYEHLLRMLLNFYLKSSKCLPLVFFPGPIPRSPLNLDVIHVGQICGEFSAQGPVPTYREGRHVRLYLREEKNPPRRLTVERKEALLSGAQLASQTKLRCPTALSTKPAPPGSRSFLTKAWAWQLKPCLLRCWWDPSKSHLSGTNELHLQSSGIPWCFGLNCVPSTKSYVEILIPVPHDMTLFKTESSQRYSG